MTGHRHEASAEGGATDTERFSVGYRLLDDRSDLFCDIVEDYRQHVDEVYFAWPGSPSGRDPIPADATGQLLWELERIGTMGIGLNVLFNASCYGVDACSGALSSHVCATVEHLLERVGLTGVTTMSPVIARAVGQRFPELDIRASVNMRLGTVEAFSYVADIFDSFCMQREYNRDRRRLAQLQSWCDRNGKRLHVLANSGCLNHCSVQTFHDNAVAHARDTSSREADTHTLCREYLSRPDTREALLTNSSWIRPEDIAEHRLTFSGRYKLATRAHENPREVIAAYAAGRYAGNTLDLLEPGLGPTLYPLVLDNAAFPHDWFARALSCDHDCESCGACGRALDLALVDLDRSLAQRVVTNSATTWSVSA